MLNKIFLQGRLVADPELRHTQNGVAVASFRLAVDRDFKDRETGERKADFINVVAWRQTGEFVSRFLTKGRLAVVEGKLQTRDYTDRTATAGTPRKWWPTTSISAIPAGMEKAATHPPPRLAGAAATVPPPATTATPPPAAVTPRPLRWISLLISPTTMGSCLSDPLLRERPCQTTLILF